jgi:flagellar protein FliO/FliZ
MGLIEEWLGVDFSQPVEFIVAFLVVMVLIGIVTLIIRSIMLRGGEGFRGRNQRRQRLFVGEWVRVDEKRRLLLVRRDDVEHLLLVGGSSDIVVEQDLTARKAQTVPVAAAQIASQPDVYAPPEEPRIPITDTGYRSPLRPEPAVASLAPAAPAAPAAGTTSAVASDMAMAEPAATSGEHPADSMPSAEVADAPTTLQDIPTEEEPKLTGLQAARARIAALRKKTAEMSNVAPSAAPVAAAGAAAGAGVATAAGLTSAEPAPDPDVPTVAAIDLDNDGHAESTAPEISVDTDGAGIETASEDGENKDDANEDELAARLREVLINPA